MSSNPVTEFFKALSNIADTQERQQLEKQVSSNGYTIEGWKNERIALVAGSGAASGILGGGVGLVAIPLDIAWCGRVGALGCFGIGLILECDIDYEQDLDLILAIWGGVGEARYTLPVGKAAVKVSTKVMPKVAGKLAGVVTKVALKSSTKLGSKLASKVVAKASTKLAAKLAAKVSTAWIPLIGGGISAGVNWWLVSSLLNAAEQYYKADYVEINDPEIESDFFNYAYAED